MGLLRALEPRAAQMERARLAEALAPALEAIRESPGGPGFPETCSAALAICRRLYSSARSSEALALAKAVQEQARRSGELALESRASTACGLLSADMGDVVGALDCHSRSLRIAACANDSVEMSRIWNNIGLAMASCGNYELAVRCYRRSLALVDHVEEPLFSRYAACSNISNSLSQLGDVAEGLNFADRALLELTPAFREQDPQSAVLLRRNLVRLLVAAGRVEEAHRHVEAILALTEEASTPRMLIAAATARAVCELAAGQADVALTRLDQALTQAREIPAVLHDTLAWTIRAEEAAGNPERALVRFRELSDHLYRFAIERARSCIELESIAELPARRAGYQEERDGRRLTAKLAAPRPPERWETLRRLGVAAAMRMDGTGWHGVRVGALTKGLALAQGSSPLQALEYGLAAELHDIGMLSVPERILAKRAPLNEAEHALVRRHVEAGAEILRDDRHPRVLVAREIARYHHARWDGCGYPERVGGKFIPLPARLCAVADAYDVMVCGLAGRPPVSMEMALQELGRCAGTQFDPELVRCFDDFLRTQTADVGLDLDSSPGMDSFQRLIAALLDDRGFV